jgi:hypothetical protein
MNLHYSPRQNIKISICCFLITLLTGMLLSKGSAANAELTPASSGRETFNSITTAEEISVKTPEPGTPDLKPPGIELVTDWDLYYSSVGFHIPLTSSPIPDLGDASELAVYQHLLRNFLHPRFLLIEMSVFPMPLAGVAMKKHQKPLYDKAVISDDFNLIESITAGFPEPYAASFFIGDIVSFVKPGEKKVGTNKGYMGYLFSFSNEHIRRNTLIKDKNYEIEWKLKGERSFEDERLSWSFRVGAKIHENRDITDAIYLGMRRNNIGFKSPFLSWLDNTSFQARLDFSQHDLNLLRQEYLVGKSYPLEKMKVALRFDVGMIWETRYQYTGRLSYLDHNGLTVILRPNIEF